MAKVSTIQILIGFTIGENVSLKSNPNTWWKPLVIKQALYLWTEPFRFSLTLKNPFSTHNFPIGGRETRPQLWLFFKALYFSCMAKNHLGSIRTCLIDLGSWWVRRREGWILYWWIPNFDLDCIGWLFIGLGGESEKELEDELTDYELEIEPKYEGRVSSESVGNGRVSLEFIRGVVGLEGGEIGSKCVCIDWEIGSNGEVTCLVVVAWVGKVIDIDEEVTWVSEEWLEKSLE